jgi:pimeloyl-ACP methyl ester carboxylesterase
MKIKQILAIQYIRAKFKVLALVSNRKAAEKAFELFCTPLQKSKKSAPGVFSLAKSLKFTLNGLTIKGYCWNKGQTKKVLILHGFSSSAYNFQAYVLPLVEKGYEVLAFDAPAHGNSGGKTINVVQYREMIELIIKEHGPIASFISHSFGGIAICLAMEKTVHDEHTKIVLIAPATETISAIDAAFTMLQINKQAIRQEFDSIIIERSGHAPKWFSIRRAMNHIKAKVLWIHDEDDTVTPLKDALKVRDDKHPNVEFLITSGLGHRNIYRSSSIKKKIFEFL